MLRETGLHWNLFALSAETEALLRCLDLSETFKRIMRKAKIDTQTVKGKGTRNFSRRTFHSLRHSFNSELANAGVAEEIRMKLTGHSSRAMNARYTHLQLDELKKAIGNVPVFKSAP